MSGTAEKPRGTVEEFPRRATTRKVAIACQGGGTHAAFTWGVLTEILRTQPARERSNDTGDRFEITGLSISDSMPC